MSAAPNPDWGRDPWPPPRVPLPPSNLPASYTRAAGPVAARILSFTVALVLLGGVLGGGWFYFKRHPLVRQQAENTVARKLPRSGDSPSAYSYIGARSHRRVTPGTDAAPHAGSGGRVSAQTVGFTLSDATQEFLAEVIDGDRHYFIRFRRVPLMMVATKDPAAVKLPAPAQPASAAAGGQAVYLSHNGWWQLTRPPENTAAPDAVSTTVVLNVFLTPTGQMDRAEVVSGPPEMVVAALEAAKRSHYDAPSAGAPAKRQVVINFSVAPK